MALQDRSVGREGRSALVLPAELRLGEIKDKGATEALWWFNEFDTLLRRVGGVVNGREWPQWACGGE